MFTCDHCKQFSELWALDSINAFIKTCNVLGFKIYIILQVHNASFPLSCIVLEPVHQISYSYQWWRREVFVSYFPILGPGQYFSTSLHACNQKAASNICHYLILSKYIQWLASIIFHLWMNVSKSESQAWNVVSSA